MKSNKLPTNPFESSRYIGSTLFVGPDFIKINISYSSSVSSKSFAGYQILGGQVGEFIFIETEDYAILGRIKEILLPDSDRLKIESHSSKHPEIFPIGFIQLLTTLELSSGRVISGIPQHPRIGEHVYSAHPLLIKHVIEGTSSDASKNIELAEIPQESNIKVNIPPSHLFGRHCAILGATGGGKSWTVARITQEISRIGGKVILIDPSGEFHTFKEGVEEIYLGGQKSDVNDTNVYVGFPYWELSELDLFAIFQPSGASQTPKLREAIKSLKLNYILNGENEPHIFIKANSDRQSYNKAWVSNEAQLEAAGAKYLIKYLPKQIIEECVSEFAWVGGKQDFTKWGNHDDKVRSYCETLVSKIFSITRSKSLKCLFNPDEYKSLTESIKSFIDSKNTVLRISMEHLPFENNIREIITNCLGRHLLDSARERKFSNNPMVVILDEAHQFLSKDLGDENNKIRLDAFGLIAKEGRKYGLTTILATQRPRDIPEDVLSQMGTFIVHRLINEKDRLVVEKACGNIDGSAADFLPTLGQGEAILVGVDFPMSMPVKIIKPSTPPKSDGPNYLKNWNVKS